MNNKSNSGWFKIGSKPYNKGKRKKLNLKEIYKEHWKKGKSIIEISKKLGVSDALIRLRMKENNLPIRKKTEHSKRIINKIRKTCIKKGIQPIERFSGKVWNKDLTMEDDRVRNNIKGLLKNRKTQVLPVKDTSIEVKIQNYLQQLGIQFFTHQYIKEIKHGYQCDIMIPVQNRIDRKTIIECFGTYWHKYPKSREIDVQRCNELREQGWRVLVFWENEIKQMHIKDLSLIINSCKP